MSNTLYRQYLETYGVGSTFKTDEGGTCYVTSQGVYYYKNGSLHRFDGPALIEKHKTAWYVCGFKVTDKIKEWAKENNLDINNLTNDDKLLIKLIWGI